ncbi:MAG: HAD family phosphatase [Gemmatimonadaceae bacterium]
MDCVLFEFENVLADTFVMRRETLRRALAKDRLAFTNAEYEEWYDCPVRQTVAAIAAARQQEFDDVDLDLAVRRVDDGFMNASTVGLSLAVGARETITALHGRVRLGIVTRARGHEVATTLALAGLDAAFDGIVTRDDAPRAKPSPDAYHAILTHLSRRRVLAPSRILAIEDGPTGVSAARAAGLRCIIAGPGGGGRLVAGAAFLPNLSGQTVASLRDFVTRDEGRAS